MDYDVSYSAHCIYNIIITQTAVPLGSSSIQKVKIKSSELS